MTSLHWNFSLSAVLWFVEGNVDGKISSHRRQCYARNLKLYLPLKDKSNKFFIIFIFLGDLQRLYPIQSLKNFPLRTVAASHDLLVVRPLLRKEKSQIQKFLVKMSDSVDQISNLKSMTRVFAASIADQSDCKGYVIEQEKDGVLAFIVATR